MIAKPLLSWYHEKGKKAFPWHSADPYRVWVSEIMLQQTQVAKVQDYFPRFIKALPQVKNLATASIDEVMSLWAGLGYYSRAHHLHQAAHIIMKKHKGRVPLEFDELIELPGIGASTAGAILSLARNMRYPILDTNVKRVLIRYFAITQQGAQLNKQLRQLAEEQLPQDQVGDYNQALMNLGASVCHPVVPRCGQCPLTKSCQARLRKLTDMLPHKKSRSIRPTRNGYFAFIINRRNAVLLERRPPTGIWSNLWCPPHFDDLNQLHQAIGREFGDSVSSSTQLPPLKHQFSHFSLIIIPVIFHLKKNFAAVAERKTMWYSIEKPDKQKAGLPAPINKLMKSIERQCAKSFA